MNNSQRSTSDSAQGADRLPPHSLEAERGVLGCVLLAGMDGRGGGVVQGLTEFFGEEGEMVWFHLPHREIWQAMVGLLRDGKGVDGLLVVSRLRDFQRLEGVGGAAYVLGLAEEVPTELHLEEYRREVWEKFLARRVMQQSLAVVQSAQEWNGVTEGMWGLLARQHEERERLLRRGEATPTLLKKPVDFVEGVYAQFFGGDTEEPGIKLPVAAKVKWHIRPGEMTVVAGDDGSGKSTILNYWALHLMAAGQKVALASFEMPAATTLWMLTCQLVGARHVPDAAEGRRLVDRAMAWLNRRILFYDFLGIGNWHDVLDTLRFAGEHMGVTAVVVDSVMRIGIPDDDYGTQGLAAAQFAGLAQQTGMHVFLVMHENKSGETGKGRIRGSKLWTANAHNVVRIERNPTKGEKLDALWNELKFEKGRKEGSPGRVADLEKEIRELGQKWDTKVVLQKQRWPGSQQNSARYVWFDRGTFQFRDDYQEAAVRWLEKWAPVRREGENKTTEYTEHTEV